MTAPTQTRVLDRLALVPTLASLVLGLSVVIFLQLSADRLAAAAVVDPPPPLLTVDSASLAVGGVDPTTIRLVDLAPQPGARPVAPTIVAAVTADDRIVGLATILGEVDGGVVNNWSTAATLVYWTDLVQMAATDSDRLARLDLSSRLPTFERLATAVGRHPLGSDEVRSLLVELEAELLTTSSVECGVVCAEAVTGAFYTFDNYSFVPVALVDANGRTCGNVPGAAAPVTGGLIRTTERLLVGAASVNSGEDPATPLIAGSETVDTSACGRTLTAKPARSTSEGLRPAVVYVIELLSGRESSSGQTADQVFRDHPNEDLAGGVVRLLTAPTESILTSSRLASLQMGDVNLSPVPEPEPSPGTESGSEPGSEPGSVPTSSTAVPPTPSTTTPTLAPTTIITQAPTTATSISRIEISMAVSFGDLPTEGTFEIEVTVRNSGNVPVNAALNAWRLGTPSGSVAPAIVGRQLSGEFPIPAAGSVTGTLSFELDDGPPRDLTLTLSNGVNVTVGF